MHADVGFQVLRLSLREDVTMFLVTLRDGGNVPLDSPREQQALLRRRLADAGWETPAILDAMAAGPHVLLRPREPDPHAVLEPGTGGPGR